MNPRKPTLTSSLGAAVLLLTVRVSSSPSFAESPKPKPRPGTLGAYAGSVTLNRSVLGDGAGKIILTNDTVATVGADGTIIFGAVAANGHVASTKANAADSAERNRWRAAYRRQQRVIVNLERRRASLEIEIDSIGRQRLTVKTMARLQRAEDKLQHLDLEIAAERRELSRIVREARRRGAEPGWFR